MTAHAQRMLSLPGGGCLAGVAMQLPVERPVCSVAVATHSSSWMDRTFTNIRRYGR